MRILATYYFMFYLSFSVFMPYTSLYFSEKGFSNTAVGIILSLWAFISVIAQPVMGVINDRMSNPRKILMISVITAPVAGIAFYFTEQIAAIIAISVLFSWFQSSSAPLSDAITVDIGNRQGFSFGSIRLWGALSYSLGSFFTGFWYEQQGYDNIFFYYLILSLIVFALLFRFPNTKPVHHRTTVFEQAKEVAGNRPFMMFLGISLLMVMSWASSFTFLPIYFKEMGFDKGLLGSAFAVAALVEVPMFWIATRITPKIGRFRVLCIAAAVYGIRCIVLYLFHDVYLTLGMQLLDGISFALAAGTFVEVVENFAGPKTKATFQTIFAAVTWGLGGIIGNAAGGVIADYMGTPVMYLILFVLCTAASVLFLAMGQAQTRNNNVSLSA